MVVLQISGTYCYHEWDIHKTGACILEYDNSLFITRTLEKRNWTADAGKLSIFFDLAVRIESKWQENGPIHTWVFPIWLSWIFLVGID